MKLKLYSTEMEKNLHPGIAQFKKETTGEIAKKSLKKGKEHIHEYIRKRKKYAKKKEPELKKRETKFAPVKKSWLAKARKVSKTKSGLRSEKRAYKAVKPMGPEHKKALGKGASEIRSGLKKFRKAEKREVGTKPLKRAQKIGSMRKKIERYKALPKVPPKAPGKAKRAGKYLKGKGAALKKKIKSATRFGDMGL